MRYRLTAGLVKMLVKYSAQGEPEHPGNRTLKHWDLIVLNQGTWRITPRGRAFLAWRIPVQEYAVTEPGKEPRLEGDYLFIDQVREKGARRTADLAPGALPGALCSTRREGGAG